MLIIHTVLTALIHRTSQVDSKRFVMKFSIEDVTAKNAVASFI